MNTIWYQLRRMDGTQIGSADAIILPANIQVFQLRDAVKNKNAERLAAMDPSDLTVYANQASFEDRATGSFLLEDAIVDQNTRQSAFVILVPLPETPGFSMKV